MMPEEIEKGIEECDNRIAYLKHRLSVREQRLQYLQDRIEKLKSGEWDANTLLKDTVPVDPSPEQLAKETTIRLYRELLVKVKEPYFYINEYGSVHDLKRCLVPEFKEYVNNCPLCDHYLSMDGACAGCPLGSCNHATNSHWGRMVAAQNTANTTAFIAAVASLIRTVGESLNADKH